MSSSDTSTVAALPYHEPNISTLLTLSSFLIASNLLNNLLDSLIYCGLIGQILIGVAFGAPGSGWLSTPTQEAITQFGYIGLVLLVYEGGLSTSPRALYANLLLSTLVAVTGISLPIALSFVLLRLFPGMTPLQAFAAGAALSSTSLGTTFTVLASTGLSRTRLGSVLTTAAMMDDVVALVLVQVIANLGGGDVQVGTVVRPIGVAVGLVLAVVLLCGFVVKPLAGLFGSTKKDGDEKQSAWGRFRNEPGTVLTAHVLLLFGFVAGAQYAGTSALFAAYLAGAVITWWNTEIGVESRGKKVGDGCRSSEGLREPALEAEQITPAADTQQQEEQQREQRDPQSDADSTPSREHLSSHTSGEALYSTYIAQSNRRILIPFFFASIGFAIPISRMFSGAVVWRGVVYTVLMAVGKQLTGLWLVRFHLDWRAVLEWLPLPQVAQFWLDKNRRSRGNGDGKEEEKKGKARMKSKTSTPPVERNSASDPSVSNHHHEQESTAKEGSNRDETHATTDTLSPPQREPSTLRNPISLYPAVLLGTAMTARGEIGFLIASLAESNGIFSAPTDQSSPPREENSSPAEPSQIYLVVVWAIALCTLAGPLALGALVRRLRGLERKRRSGERSGEGSTSVFEPLGEFGIQADG